MDVTTGGNAACVRAPAPAPATATATAPATTFLSLPAELRNLIYEQLLVYRAPFRLEKFLTFATATQPPHWKIVTLQTLRLCPALLRTSRQVHDEASMVLYSRNVFGATNRTLDTETLAFFADVIGPWKASLVRQLYVPFPLRSLSMLSMSMSVSDAPPCAGRDAVYYPDLLRTKFSKVRAVVTSLEPYHKDVLCCNWGPWQPVECSLAEANRLFSTLSSEPMVVNVRIREGTNGHFWDMVVRESAALRWTLVKTPTP